MKKTILLLFVILCSVQFSNAQSDATWEETIDWINSKLNEGGEFHLSKGTSFKPKDSYPTEFLSSSLTIDYRGNCNFQKKYILNRKEDSYPGKTFSFEGIKNKYEFNFFDVKEVKVASDAGYIGLRLILNGKLIRFEYKNYNVDNLSSWKQTGSRSSSINSLYFFIRDSDAQERLIKAFNHLIVLAREKKKKERATSGEKF